MDKKLFRPFRKAFLPLIVTATIASASGAYAADVVAKVGSIPLKGGKHQITINGRPIYTKVLTLATKSTPTQPRLPPTDGQITKNH